MPHQRQLIREAVKAALLNKTAAGTRVQKSRIVTWRRLELPAIAVYTTDEPVDPESRHTSPRELSRTVAVAIEACASVTDDLDDVLDGLALEIEKAAHADPTFGGVCSDSGLSNTEIGLVADGDRPMGMVRLTYSASYFTYAPEAADVVLDDFKKADIKYSLGNAQPAGDKANDVIEPNPPDVLYDPEGDNVLDESGGAVEQG